MDNDAIDGKDDSMGGVDEKRRALIKGILGGAGAYSMPLVVSFSMSGLRVGSAHAEGSFVPPGLSAGDEVPPAFEGNAKGRPFSDPHFNPPGRPFRPLGGNQPF